MVTVWAAGVESSTAANESLVGFTLSVQGGRTFRATASVSGLPVSALPWLSKAFTCSVAVYEPGARCAGCALTVKLAGVLAEALPCIAERWSHAGNVYSGATSQENVLCPPPKRLTVCGARFVWS